MVLKMFEPKTTQAKARIWPLLSYLVPDRSTSVTVISAESFRITYRLRGFEKQDVICVVYVSSPLLRLTRIFQRVTMGSAAWFGPKCPSSPRPVMPVRPCGGHAHTGRSAIGGRAHRSVSNREMFTPVGQHLRACVIVRFRACPRFG